MVCANHENIFTTKISRSTVVCVWNRERGKERERGEREGERGERVGEREREGGEAYGRVIIHVSM